MNNGKAFVKSKLTVIGFGRMGKKFAEVFKEGFSVGVYSSRNIGEEVKRMGLQWITEPGEAIRTSEFIFLATPIHALDSVIERINNFVQPSSWAFDMCSARVEAAQKMSGLKCRWFGLHAGGIFGEAPDRIVDYLAQKGHLYRPMAPEEHDQRNSIIAMIHFIGMAAESILTDTEKEILATSPAAAHFLRLIDHLKNNSPSTYMESQLCNTFTTNQRRRILKGLSEYADELDQGRFPFSP